MSFFQDVPPPLEDDKTREVDDFDLDDESSSRISTELPEISNSNFDVYNSSTSTTLKPPELNASLFFDEPPPDDDYDPSKVSREDSFEDFVYHESTSPLNNESGMDENTVTIEDYVEKKSIDDVINDNSPLELSQLEDPVVEKPIENDDESSRTLDTSIEHQVLGELILSPDEMNMNVNFEMDSFEAPPFDSPEIPNDPPNSMETDNGAVSSFSTSLTCNADIIVDENLHSEFTEDVNNYAEVITFNLQHGEKKINHDGDDCESDIFKLKFNQDVTENTHIDDDDDDFNDFEAAIPVHRTIETQSSVTSFEAPIEEVRFEADFSAFNEPAEIDDDFGDFNDFETAPMASNDIAQETTHSIEFAKPSNVIGLIGEMFPSDIQQCGDERIEMKNECYANSLMKSDDIVRKLNDFDATFALGYLYNNSSSSQILVKALGIDTRNILLGPQWGNSSSSSSSNMPRFASNLSFNPLEPLKPVSSSAAPPTISSIKSESSDVKISALPQSSKSDVIAPTVPEVQFDWNSSGLVNPLDGKQPNAQQSNIDEPKKAVQSTAVFKSTSPITVSQQSHTLKNEQTSNAVDEEEMTQPQIEPSFGSSGTELDVNLSKFSSWEPPSFQAPASSILVRERTIKLPETHIFTPVKSTSPVAREVISRDGSPAIVVKEYHDVEYIEPKRKPELENEFDEFQSASVEPAPVLMPSLLLPQKVENQKSNTISWPSPGEIVEDFGFMEISNDTKSIELAIDTTENSTPAFNDIKSTKPNIKRELPVIGNSPSKHIPADDDDFADFQAAPVISMPNQSIKLTDSSYQCSGEVLKTNTFNTSKNSNHTENKTISNEPLTLSPSRLVTTMKNQRMSQQPSWITSMDDDEVSRIEAAFPKCKVSPKPKTNDADDDDWCDFVGVSTQQQQQSLNITNHQKTDDWSDFVSAPPAPNSTVNSISSQILSKPNFTSWNQPSKPYVHHATSFLSSEPKNFNSTGYQYASSNQRAGMNITNNFSYQHNGISTILPDLDFAMPRNLINLPRGGTESSGKK